MKRLLKTLRRKEKKTDPPELIRARSAAAEYTAKALEALEVFDDNDFVKSLTSSLLGRKK